MVRTVQLLLRAALLGGILVSLPKSALPQDVPPAFASSSPSQNAGEPEFLKSLPHPPDQPRSLSQTAPSLGYPHADLEPPYLTEDPLLDPPYWPEPGWFCDAQVSVVSPYVQNEMSETVVTGLGTPLFVQLGAARLNWTAVPRLELGYRLPSGFGEFSISDTAMTANGGETFLGPNGPATRTSSLQFNYTDLDYLSREFMPLPCWEMKWRVGMRIAESFTTTTFNQAFAQAAAGSGILTAQQSNATFGFGPHGGVEVERAFVDTGFSWVGKVDLGYNYTHIRQRFSATGTTLVAPGVFDSGVTTDRFLNQVIMLNAQAGLAWRPATYPNSRLFLGYIIEAWWNPLSNDNTFTSLGQFYYQGVTFRASWNF
jgi:hypothetical protein